MELRMKLKMKKNKILYPLLFIAIGSIVTALFFVLILDDRPYIKDVITPPVEYMGTVEYQEYLTNLFIKNELKMENEISYPQTVDIAYSVYPFYFMLVNGTSLLKYELIYPNPLGPESYIVITNMRATDHFNYFIVLANDYWDDTNDKFFADVYYIIWETDYDVFNTYFINSKTPYIETNLTQETISKLFPEFKGKIVYNVKRKFYSTGDFVPSQPKFYEQFVRGYVNPNSSSY